MRRKLDAHVWAWMEFQWLDESVQIEKYLEESDPFDFWTPPIAHHWLALDGWRTAYDDQHFHLRNICLTCGNVLNSCIC